MRKRVSWAVRMHVSLHKNPAKLQLLFVSIFIFSASQNKPGFHVLSPGMVIKQQLRTITQESQTQPTFLHGTGQTRLHLRLQHFHQLQLSKQTMTMYIASSKSQDYGNSLQGSSSSYAVYSYECMPRKIHALYKKDGMKWPIRALVFA